MPKNILLVIAVICCALSGCDKKKIDLSTPTAALKTYGQAMRDGDAATARRAVINADPKVIDALASMGASRRRVIDAAVARFGEEGKTVAGGSSVPYGEEFDKMLSEADVKIDGETATITQKTAEAIPITLKRMQGEWKIDYSDMTRRGDLAQLIPVMNAMAKANNELADEIKSGKYSSAADAKKARANKMQEALMSRIKNPNLPSTAASQPR